MEPLPPACWSRVLVLAVHPDDESLGAGGLIQRAAGRGADVRVIVVTDGESNPWPQRFVERRWRIDPAARNRWGSRRQLEAIAALKCLGVADGNLTFWHFPDLGITRFLSKGDGEITEKMEKEIREWRPTLIVGPSSRDLHPDHNACAVMLRFALQSYSSIAARPVVLEYGLHTPRGEGVASDFEIVLSTQEQARKRQAILQHETQLALSRRRFLAFASEKEAFEIPSVIGRPRSGPVLSATLLGDQLRLAVKKVRIASSFTVVARDGTGGLIRHLIRLTASGQFEFSDPFSGEAGARGQITKVNDENYVFLPGAPFRSVTSLFVKLRGGWGIFDRMGWEEIPVASTHEEFETPLTDSPASTEVAAIIPCYNVGGTCGAVVRAATEFAAHVIAVNDGSSDDTRDVLLAAEAAYPRRVHVISWTRNRGKGAALLEAFRYARGTLPGHVLVTLDGDGQHRPRDIAPMFQMLIQGQYALVVGERMARKKMPFRSRLGNGLTATLLKRIFPEAPFDTQSGFRAFAPEFVEEILKSVAGGRYETELQILVLALRQRRRIGSVSIPTLYIDNNRLSHFRPVIDSWRIYHALLRSFVRRS